MNFEVTILGCNGAIPAYDRHPTSQYLSYHGKGFLIDCGEGTLMQMNKFGIKRSKLDTIFISHLHGDHFFGLMGIITSFNLNYRETPLHIYGPEGLEEIVNTHFKYSNTILRFPLHFYTTNHLFPTVIYEDKYITVTTIPLLHRIPTTGFLFREKKPHTKLRIEKIEEYAIPVEQLSGIKEGADYTHPTGLLVKNEELIELVHPPRSYAFCSDTMYNENMVEQIKNVTLLYHEATFAKEHQQRAMETMHSTTFDAAVIAKLSNVERLLIGHYSARYESLGFLLEEAQEVFAKTELAIEGTTYII